MTLLGLGLLKTALLISNVVTVSPFEWRQTSGPEAAAVLSFLEVGDRLYAGTTLGVYESSDGASSWRRTGPELDRQVGGLAMIGNALYAAAGGGYRSLDGGRTWEELRPLDSLGVPVFIDNVTSIGGSLFAGNLCQILESRDGGYSWQGRNLGPSCPGFVSHIDSFGDTLLAAVNKENSRYEFVGREIYRSTDDGMHWSLVLAGTCEYPIFMSNPVEWNGAIFVGGPCGGLLESKDDGATWSPAGLDGKVGALAVLSGTLYASLTSGLLRDSGSGWEPVPGSPASVDSLFSFQGGLLVIGTGGLSRFDGASFVPAAYGLASSTVDSLVADGSIVLALSDVFSIQRTVDAGGHWGPAGYGLPESPGESLMSAGGLFFASGFQAGLYRSTDGGTTFSPTAGASAGSWIVAVVQSGDALLAAGFDVLIRSSDAGATWTKVTSDLPQGFRVIRLFAWGDRILCTASGDSGGGVFVSVDGGSHWTLSELKGGNAFAALGSTIFASGFNGGVSRSSDGGLTWTSAGLEAFEIRSLAVSDTTLFASGPGGVFSSVDGGAYWITLNSGLCRREEEFLPSRYSFDAPLAVSGTTLLVGTDGCGVQELVAAPYLRLPPKRKR